jgi:hypothetical protein
MLTLRKQVVRLGTWLSWLWIFCNWIITCFSRKTLYHGWLLAKYFWQFRRTLKPESESYSCDMVITMLKVAECYLYMLTNLCTSYTLSSRMEETHLAIKLVHIGRYFVSATSGSVRFLYVFSCQLLESVPALFKRYAISHIHIRHLDPILYIRQVWRIFDGLKTVMRLPRETTLERNCFCRRSCRLRFTGTRWCLFYRASCQRYCSSNV